jgi:phosphate-selective porin OprO/OprP
MARCWRLVVFLAVVAWTGGGLTVQAQGFPELPLPVPTPTPTPSPLDPAPVPDSAPDTTAPDRTTAAGEDAAEPGESADDEPKAEKEVNPGEVAFTDYQPFDLEKIQEEPFESKWKNFVAGWRGITRYSLFDDKVKFRIGGRFQVDGTAGSGDDVYELFYPPIDGDVDFRRLTAFAAGRILQFNFNLAFDFGTDWGVDSAWIEGAKGGLEVWGAYLGKLRIGLLNEPFSLERQTSAYNIGFLERSLPVQTIAPGSNIGAMVHDSGPKGRFTWAAGLFSIGQTNDKNASNSLLSVTGRGTYCPVHEDEGRRIIHFGVSFSARSPSGGDTRYRARPEARFVDYLVNTDYFDASHIRLIGAEFAAIRGPLWLAAEYIHSDVSAQLVGDPNFGGFYVEVGRFLSGESRPYRSNSGTFDRLKPNRKYGGGNPFKRKNGGAWEVVGRISRVDLTSGEIQGGEMTDISAALNWYPNATSRVQVNYIRANPKDRGVANIFLLRVQFQPW